MAVIRRGEKEKRRQAREDAILDAAHELMTTHGYAAMTMDDLAARAGITKPTLYQHFPSKEAVAVQSVLRLMRRGYDFLDALDPNLPAMRRLEQGLRWLLEEKFVRGKTSFGSARATLVPVIRAHPEYQAVFGCLVEALSRIVEDGKAEDAIAPDLETRAVVQMWFSVMRDADYEELLRSDACRADAMINTLVSVLLNGLRKDNGPRADDRKTR